MVRDKQNLVRIGRMWYVRLKIPASVAAHYGGHTHKRQSLRTEKLEDANRLKGKWVELWRKEFDQREGKSAFSSVADDLRFEIKREASRGNEAAVDALRDHAQVKAEAIAESHDLPTAQRFFALATAQTPTLSKAMEEWLPTAGSRKGTQTHYRLAVERLLEFFGGDAVPDSVTEARALDYYDHLLTVYKTRATFQGKLRPLGAFWEWMGVRRYVPRGFNPWRGRGLKWPNERAMPKAKRPFADDELLTLLHGTATYKGSLAEIVMLGLYTGARLDELCSLRVADLTPMKGRTSGFVVKIGQTGGKREASIRTIVVTHAVPVGVLKGRRNAASKKDDAGALLFPDLIPGGPDDKLSWHVSKAFGRYRDDCKLPRGVDFHSLRRTFITRLENTQGMDQVKIARYVGHQIKGVTFGVYSGGSTERTMRMVADAIKFPAKIERAAVGFLERAKGEE